MFLNPDAKLTNQDVHFSYLPLPHVFERVFSWCSTQSGVDCRFISGDV
jgi:long-subunit acyl-CoA synthetase (AMP-forming)